MLTRWIKSPVIHLFKMNDVSHQSFKLDASSFPSCLWARWMCIMHVGLLLLTRMNGNSYHAFGILLNSGQWWTWKRERAIPFSTFLSLFYLWNVHVCNGELLPHLISKSVLVMNGERRSSADPFTVRWGLTPEPRYETVSHNHCSLNLGALLDWRWNKELSRARDFSRSDDEVLAWRDNSF